MQVSFSLKNGQSLFTVSFIFCSLKMYVEQQQQLVVDIEKLRSDKADLLTRLQCYEEELKTANECENFVIIILNLRLSFSIENEGESYFRYDGNSTQEGH